KRLIRPKTTADYLARLPQFEPRPIPFADFQEECPRGEPQEVGPQNTREKRIDDVLSKFMAPYIRDATKLKPFLNDAKRAIAGYVGARETEYDRRKAKKLLSAASIALETTKRKLQEIDQWPELSSYLKRLHRDAGRRWQDESRDWDFWSYYDSMGFARMVEEKMIIPSGKYRPNKAGVLEPVYVPNPEFLKGALQEQPQASPRKQVKQEFQRRVVLDRNYSDFAPDQIAWR